jgi:hypothetical protein
VDHSRQGRGHLVYREPCSLVHLGHETLQACGKILHLRLPMGYLFGRGMQGLRKSGTHPFQPGVERLFKMPHEASAGTREPLLLVCERRKHTLQQGPYTVTHPLLESHGNMTRKVLECCPLLRHILLHCYQNTGRR